MPRDIRLRIQAISKVANVINMYSEEGFKRRLIFSLLDRRVEAEILLVQRIRPQNALVPSSTLA